MNALNQMQHRPHLKQAALRSSPQKISSGQTQNSWHKRRGRQEGFTLMELVCVIVILGFLAAIALPAFKDNQKAAKEAQAKAISGAIEIASMNNRMAYSLKAVSSLQVIGTRAAICTNARAELMLGAPLPSGATVTQDVNGSLAFCNALNTAIFVSCSVVVTGSDGTEYTSNFNYYCAR